MHTCCPCLEGTWAKGFQQCNIGTLFQSIPYPWCFLLDLHLLAWVCKETPHCQCMMLPPALNVQSATLSAIKTLRTTPQFVALLNPAGHGQ